MLCHLLFKQVLRLRPFEETDFDLALPFYGDPDFLNAMEGQPPEEPITGDYLRRAGEAMAKQAWRNIVGQSSTVENSHEPIPYRFAILGIFLALTFLVLVLRRAGLLLTLIPFYFVI